MPGHDIIVVGASAGGVEALTRLVGGLPADLPASVFVVLHVPAYGASVLPSILARNGPLPARHPADGEEIKPGTIYVAPPDFHLLVDRGRVRLSRGPRENGHRPSVDPLFRTAARSYGRRVVGVVLSGSLDDGSSGLMTIKRRGGMAVVQDPEDALYYGMPRSAMEAVAVDRVLPIAAIGPALAELAHEPVAEAGGEDVSDDLHYEAEIAAFDLDALNIKHHPGTPSGFACPDCAGGLWEIQEGELIRFRCRVGHAWSSHGLLAEQANAVEEALWIALRALEERAALSGRLAERLQRAGNPRTAGRFEEQAHEARQRAALLRQVLLSEPRVNVDPPAPVTAAEAEAAANGAVVEGPDG